MRNYLKILKIGFFVAVILFAGCSSSRKNPYYSKRNKASESNASKLGRNSYYFSPNYQKKLVKSYKRR